MFFFLHLLYRYLGGDLMLLVSMSLLELHQDELLLLDDPAQLYAALKDVVARHYDREGLFRHIEQSMGPSPQPWLDSFAWSAYVSQCLLGERRGKKMH